MNVSKTNKIKIASILIILAVWVISYITSPIYGLLNGLYFASILTGIYLFRTNIITAISLNIISQLVILATFLLNGESISQSIYDVGYEFPILVVMLSGYIIINLRNRNKHGENKRFKIHKLSTSGRVITISLLVLTTISIINTTDNTILTALYLIVIPLLSLVSLVLHTVEYYYSMVIYSIIGLYVCYMQLVIGQLPYLHIIVHMILLIASLNEIQTYNKLNKQTDN